MEIVKLYSEPGPFATVYVTQPAVERTALQAQLRWNALQGQLRSSGAPEEVLSAIEEVLLTRSTTPVRAVVASAAGVLLDQPLPARTEMEEAHWSPLPRLLPLLSMYQDLLPFVLVRIDRTGADLEAYPNRLEPAHALSVQGSHDELRKVHAGGWSYRRYEYRAMDSWEGNAKEVAAALDPLVREVNAQLVLVSGDVQATQYLCSHVSGSVKPLVQRLNGHGRAVDGGEPVLQGMVEEAVSSFAALSTREVVERFVQERGQQDLAADGPEATLQALSLSQVDTLLVSRTSCEGTALFGDSPNEVGLERSLLDGMGVSSPEEAPLCDVAVRSALMTGAKVVVVDDPGLLSGGIGATLRFRMGS